MKNYILLLLLFLGIIPKNMACDVCGGGLSFYSMNNFATQQANFLSVRFRQARFESNFGNHPIFASQETFRALELQGRFKIRKNLFFAAQLPYIDFKQSGPIVSLEQKGFGDGFFSLHYVLLNKKDSTKKSMQQLLFNPGIKAPTGAYFIDQTHLSSFQLSTKSWDMFALLQYVYTKKKIGFQSEIGYKYNTSNKFLYKFANKMNTNLLFWRTFTVKNISFVGKTGFLYEYAQKDRLKNKLVEYSGTNYWAAFGGIDFFFRRLLISGQYQQPIYQSLAAGRMSAFGQLQISLGMVF